MSDSDEDLHEKRGIEAWESALNKRRFSKPSQSNIGYFNQSLQRVELLQLRGKTRSSMGYNDHGTECLHPIEALHLLDRGHLILVHSQSKDTLDRMLKDLTPCRNNTTNKSSNDGTNTDVGSQSEVPATNNNTENSDDDGPFTIEHIVERQNTKKTHKQSKEVSMSEQSSVDLLLQNHAGDGSASPESTITSQVNNHSTSDVSLTDRATKRTRIAISDTTAEVHPNIIPLSKAYMELLNYSDTRALRIFADLSDRGFVLRFRDDLKQVLVAHFPKILDYGLVSFLDVFIRVKGQSRNRPGKPYFRIAIVEESAPVFGSSELSLILCVMKNGFVIQANEEGLSESSLSCHDNRIGVVSGYGVAVTYTSISNWDAVGGLSEDPKCLKE